MLQMGGQTVLSRTRQLAVVLRVDGQTVPSRTKQLAVPFREAMLPEALQLLVQAVHGAIRQEPTLLVSPSLQHRSRFLLAPTRHHTILLALCLQLRPAWVGMHDAPDGIIDEA